MVGPPQRRRAVELLQERLGVSQRRACQIVGQHRSTQRYALAEADPDRDLRAELRKFAKDHSRWGYRRAHAVLQRRGWAVNRKKVQRIWREEGLRVPPKKRKRRRTGDSDADAGLLTAERPDHVWALDYQFDVTASGRKIKILHVLDEFTRESLADVVDHSIDADATVQCLDKIASQRGCCPEFVRCDNGPELTAHALRDWCRLTSTKTSYIDPGSPWQNPSGRTRGSPTAAECATSCWPSSNSTASSRPKYLSPTGETTTTHTAPTPRSACSHQPNTQTNGRKTTRKNSHNRLMCPLFFGPVLWESGGVWLLLVASLELGG